jgi:hypothetical protein
MQNLLGPNSLRPHPHAITSLRCVVVNAPSYTPGRLGVTRLIKAFHAAEVQAEAEAGAEAGGQEK